VALPVPLFHRRTVETVGRKGEQAGRWKERREKTVEVEKEKRLSSFNFGSKKRLRNKDLFLGVASTPSHFSFCFCFSLPPVYQGLHELLLSLLSVVINSYFDQPQGAVVRKIAIG
jgi:hypothetical protein